MNNGLTITEIIELVNFIDKSAERGNIHGDELFSIGNIRQKLKDIVNYNNQQTKSE